MPTDPRVDAYIDKSADFAKPILRYLRETVHAVVPAATETVKWGMPFFEYHGLLCNMAAFKEHCAFGFWKRGSVVGEHRSDDAMGQLGRITKVGDLPPKKELSRMIKEAAKLNEAGAKAPARPAAARKAKPPVEAPPELTAALAKNTKARKAFEAFPPSHRREYIDWIVEAKTAPTRERRIAQAVEWIAEGKSRNWKYERK